MWTTTFVPKTPSQFRPNHFVALIKIHPDVVLVNLTNEGVDNADSHRDDDGGDDLGGEFDLDVADDDDDSVCVDAGGGGVVVSSSDDAGVGGGVGVVSGSDDADVGGVGSGANLDDDDDDDGSVFDNGGCGDAGGGVGVVSSLDDADVGDDGSGANLEDGRKPLPCNAFLHTDVLLDLLRSASLSISLEKGTQWTQGQCILR